MENRTISLSVHALIDSLLRKGDIDNRIYNRDTMLLGSKLHAAYQEKQGNVYLSEVPLKGTFKRNNLTIILDGRADGIILSEKYPIIDEIKTTVAPLDDFYNEQKDWHFGQAECYAYLYLLNNGGNEALITLTYISQIDNSKKQHKRKYTFKELEEKVNKYIDLFLERENEVLKHIEERNTSIKSLSFPYSSFRLGQREMAKYVYGTALKGGIFFCQAPTGIGKTISALYPAIKAMHKGKISRIFYLTAKNSGKRSAESALGRLDERGFLGRSITITSKENICLAKGKECNPDDCPFAKHYYDIFPLVRERALKQYQRFQKEDIKKIATEFHICPFELELDLSLDCEIIICDYNYVFDPFSYLERYFGMESDHSSYLLLIDEAHNLLDRVRKSYSEKISLYELKKAKKALKGYPKKGLILSLSKMIQSLREELKNEETPHKLEQLPKNFIKGLERFLDNKKKIEKERINPPLPKEINDLSTKIYRFYNLYSEYPLLAYFNQEGKDSSFGLLCLDPSIHIKKMVNEVKGAIFYSATLSPIPYFMESLLSENNYPYLMLPSPFKKEQFKLLLAPLVSTRYKDRDITLTEVASYIISFLKGKTGNYFIYFPSFAYLNKLEKILSFPSNYNIYRQKETMDEKEKEELLSHFSPSPKETNIALLVLGGSFGEGIDLPLDRLIGVIVVGVGLPQVCLENEALKDNYEQKEADGFSFAYKFPGLNRVMQAVGRLIRSEKDKGAALLIDDRYAKEEYREVFASIWPDYQIVTSPLETYEITKAFYKEKEK